MSEYKKKLKQANDLSNEDIQDQPIDDEAA